MSRRKKSSRRKVPDRSRVLAEKTAGGGPANAVASPGGPVTAAETPPDRGAPNSAQGTSKRLLIMAVIVAVGWWLTLAGLAIFTANPVTLNHDQIDRADEIVTATILDSNRRMVSIEKQWRRDTNANLDSLGDFLRLENLDRAGGKVNRRYVIPLSEIAPGQFHVTETRLPQRPPVIYPATPETYEQLKRLLNKPTRQTDKKGAGARMEKEAQENASSQSGNA